ncbi:nucleotidyltransferase domain-containing protein [Agromyces sp. CCNWLW203]|uniref:nucleotidyltransferase domain-containing protein n=1 Tax=Agromyces sp. CCNWLW203 TaxID=3112842 RepID=UPI002F96E588
MLLQHPFEALTTSVDGECLAVLAKAEHEFTASRLVPLLKKKRSLSGVRNALDRLADQGVVEMRHVGNVKSYTLNRSHLLAPAIIAIATVRDRFLEQATDELLHWRPTPIYAALFGSAARGEMRADSDIDLLLVRPDDADIALWADQMAHLQRLVTSWTGNDTRVLDFSEQEVRDHAMTDPVLREIAREGIGLIGPTSWLRRLTTKQAS